MNPANNKVTKHTIQTKAQELKSLLQPAQISCAQLEQMIMKDFRLCIDDKTNMLRHCNTIYTQLRGIDLNMTEIISLGLSKFPLCKENK